jgi:hypothetical protein
METRTLSVPKSTPATIVTGDLLSIQGLASDREP